MSFISRSSKWPLSFGPFWRQYLSLNDIFLELDFGGDKAELYADGRLIDDWFSNGEVWRVALRRYGFPQKLVLKVYPFDDKVYYDLEPKKGCRFNGAKLTRVI